MRIKFCLITLILMFLCGSAVIFAYALQSQTIFFGGTVKINIKAFEGGDGSQQAPYQISDEAQLFRAVQHWRAHSGTPVFFKQVADIKITKDHNGDAAGNFFPFGLADCSAPLNPDSYIPFSGGYDGGGFMLFGLNIQGVAFSALFATAEEATLTNIHISESRFDGVYKSAAIAAQAYGCTINLCSANSEISCGGAAGGIAGSTAETLITQSYNSGRISGQTAAGIAAEIEAGTQISAVYNTGEIVGTESASGIGGTIAENALATDVVSAGRVSGNRAYALFAGNPSSATVKNAYYFSNYPDASLYPLIGVEGATALYDTQLRNKSNFGFSSPDLWTTGINAQNLFYPFVRLAANRHRYEGAGGHYMHGDGSGSAPFVIHNAAALRLTGNKNGGVSSAGKPYLLDSNYILSKDIDLNHESSEPIGNFNNPFKGVFDGNGKIVSGLNIQKPDGSMTGFFGVLNSAQVYGLNIRGASINGGRTAGILSGQAYDSKIEGCSATGDVSGIDYVGGLTGDASGGGTQIISCFSGGTVKSSLYYAGGLAGFLSAGTISGCFSYSDILADSMGAGGFVGYNYSGNIINCYSTGKLYADYFTGGFAAGNSGTITNCYTVGQMAAGVNNGGFAAESSGSVSGCFYNNEINNISSAAGEGKTTLDMHNPDIYTYSAWSGDIWLIQGGGYPKLKDIDLAFQDF